MKDTQITDYIEKLAKRIAYLEASHRELQELKKCINFMAIKSFDSLDLKIDKNKFYEKNSWEDMLLHCFNEARYPEEK